MEFGVRSLEFGNATLAADLDRRLMGITDEKTLGRSVVFNCRNCLLCLGLSNCRSFVRYCGLSLSAWCKPNGSRLDHDNCYPDCNTNSGIRLFMFEYDQRRNIYATIEFAVYHLLCFCNRHHTRNHVKTFAKTGEIRNK